jgi:periplasmic protein TonB
MFEQSMVMAGPASRWSMMSSLLLQATAVGGLLLVPLVWWERLPELPPLPPALYSPKLPPSIKVFTEGFQRSTPSPVTLPRLFVAPTVIPPSVAKVDDRGRVFEEVAIGNVGQRNGVLDSLMPTSSIGNAAPPPPVAKPAEAKPAAPPAPKSVSVASTLQASKLIHQVKPLYPDIAKRTGVQGNVRLHAIIAQDGSVQRLQVVSGHPVLVPAAVEAVKQWRYSPTLLGGNPVEVVTQVDVNFVLAR